jgi:hypothetical protein
LGDLEIKELRNILILLVLILTGAVFMISGCGIKAPPVAPKQLSPSTVKDLKGIIEGPTYKLTWSVPDAGTKVASGMAGFIVYRSKVPLSDSHCPACPVLFERVEDIPMKGKSNIKMKYVDTLESGYRYTYKVITYNKKGSQSKDSNFVSIDYP